MRQNKSSGEIVAVLNTIPELGVLLDAIQDPTFDKGSPVAANPEQAELDTASRFIDQTRLAPNPLFQPAKFSPTQGSALEVSEEWAYKAEFFARQEDVDFITRAAQRVIETKNPLKKTRNIVTKRQKAAEDILSFLGHTEN